MTNRGATRSVTFEANPAVVWPFSTSEFTQVSTGRCSFVLIFCIRLRIWPFSVGFVFVPDDEIWPKTNHDFFGQI